MLRSSIMHRTKIFYYRNFTIHCRSQTRTNFNSSQENRSIKRSSAKRAPIIDEHNIFRGPFNDLEIPSGYLHQYIWEHAGQWWNKTAILCAATGRSHTYGELRELCGKFATSLRRNKLMPGDTIAVLLPNIPEYAVVILGASEAGVKLTLLNTKHTAYEIKSQIENAEPTAVITTQDKYPMIMDIIKETNSIRMPPIVVPNDNEPVPANSINFRDLVGSKIEEFEKIGEETGIDDRHDTFLIPYSSGTTGIPKGVEITHRNIIANLTQFLHEEYNITEPAVGDFQESLALFLPLYALSTVVIGISSLMRYGGKVICLPEFSPLNLRNIFEQHQVTVLYAVPPAIQLIANDPRFTKNHLENIKEVKSAAAPLGAELIGKFISKMGTHFRFTQAYGMTETSPVIACSKYADCKSVGPIVVNTQLRIVDRNEGTGKNLGFNETGEIVVRGPQVMKGYYKNAEATENCMDGEWYKTGDLGHIDEKGHLFITGRLKELIKVKGFQVAPAELEDVLYGHEKIVDAAVIGEPHEKWGEIPKAFVVPKPGVKITEEEIKNYVAERLAVYKHLGEVVFMNQIPKNALGKILREELRKL